MKKSGVITIICISIIILSLSFVSAGLMDWLQDLFTPDSIQDETGELATLTEESQTLIAHYSFENNANDISGNNHHGTVNGPTFTTGISGQSLQFDGTDDYVEVPNNPDFDITEQITLSAWIYPTDFSAGVDGYQGIVGKGMNRCYLMYIRNSRLGLDIKTDISRNILTKGTLQENKWQHILTTYDGTTMKWYIDGVLIGTQAFTGDIRIMDEPIIIGSILPTQTAKYPEFFKGKIDEVKIWNYALTGEEIIDEYENNIKCIDSDGGKDYFVKGDTKGYEMSPNDYDIMTDYCGVEGSTMGKLHEFYCGTDDNIFEEIYECPNGCEDGACIEETTECTDSDDGKNYETKGTTISGNLESTDSCIDDKNLKEYYCSDRVESEDYACPYECYKDICINETWSTCTDSDRGKEYYIEGHTESYNRTNGINAFDSCEDNKILREHYCYNDWVRTESYECPYRCSDDVCVNETTKIISSYTDAYPFLVEEGQDITFYHTIKVNEDDLNSIPESLQVSIKKDGGDIKKIEVFKKEGSASCYTYCRVAYSNIVNNLPNGDYEIVGESEFKYFKILKKGWFDENLVLDEKYGENSHFGFYHPYEDYIFITVFYQNEDLEFPPFKIAGLMISDGPEKLDKMFAEVFEEFFGEIVGMPEISFQPFNLNGNNIYLLQFSEGWDDFKFVIAFWKGENHIVYVAEILQNKEEREIDITEEEFMRGLIGRGHSYKREEVNIDDFSELGKELVEDYLEKWESTFTQEPITCIPQWKCNLNPLICPEYGRQTETCQDSSNCTEPYFYTKTIDCQPGLCSGCLHDKRCIPYGSRFQSEEVIVELPSLYDVELIEVEENPEPVPASSTASGGSAVAKPIPTSGGGGGGGAAVPVKKGEGIPVKPQPQKTNYYCDIDGRIKKQKTPDAEGNWANCQNNYECESNFCTSGECIEIIESIQKASKLKVVLFKLLCKIAHPISLGKYNQCIIDTIGEEYVEEPEEPGTIPFDDWDWNNCKNIFIEPTITMENAILEVNITGISFSDTNEIRVVNRACGLGGNEVKSTVLHNGIDWAYVTFLADLNGDDLTYSVYYNNPNNPEKSEELVDDFCEFNDFCDWNKIYNFNGVTTKGILDFTLGGLSSPKTINKKNVLIKIFQEPTSIQGVEQIYGLGGTTPSVLLRIDARPSDPHLEWWIEYSTGKEWGVIPNSNDAFNKWIYGFIKIDRNGKSEFSYYDSKGLIGSALVTKNSESNDLHLIFNSHGSVPSQNSIDYIRAYDIEANYLPEQDMPIFSIGPQIDF